MVSHESTIDRWRRVWLDVTSREIEPRRLLPKMTVRRLMALVALLALAIAFVQTYRRWLLYRDLAERYRQIEAVKRDSRPTLYREWVQRFTIGIRDALQWADAAKARGAKDEEARYRQLAFAFSEYMIHDPEIIVNGATESDRFRLLSDKISVLQKEAEAGGNASEVDRWRKLVRDTGSYSQQAEVFKNELMEVIRLRKKYERATTRPWEIPSPERPPPGWSEKEHNYQLFKY